MIELLIAALAAASDARQRADDRITLLILDGHDALVDAFYAIRDAHAADADDARAQLARALRDAPLSVERDALERFAFDARRRLAEELDRLPVRPAPAPAPVELAGSWDPWTAAGLPEPR